ncbi:MAG: exodeoxyribonuclease V subunit beta [Candidatus Thiodiazotropha sp. (ex Gloverina cf. vestifex)]|nr:exodeoxyribonuclease V subunit beta [Candidatus Thiodiazotropha sp. (ex Gloverina cf. vestifex)]
MGMDISSVSLQGINLVEASAGTGKTYTLTTLYLRLLLEKGLEPEQILVVTYTQAATAELKGRIRQRLLATRQMLEEDAPGEPGLTFLIDAMPDRVTTRKQLDLAIAGFDQASIFTIHGFCQRVLTEHAFETGQGFQVELVPDQSARLQQIADDFWRCEMEQLPARFLDAFRQKIATPEALLSRFRLAHGKPYLQVRAADWPEDLDKLEAETLSQQSQLRDLWIETRETIRELLSDSQVLKGNAYRSNWVAGWCRQMDDWLNASPYTPAFDKADRFTPEVISAAVKTGKNSPDHPFFGQFADYLQQAKRCVAAGGQAMVALQKRFHDYLLEELPKQQSAAGEWSYDDLLLQLHQALLHRNGNRLAALLRRRYPAALVDEFQDTDPIQYEILHHIYHKSELPLFLVGDPKQAIYSFRGADIFAYLRTRQASVSAIHSLDKNWRSTPGLVQAVNTLFSQPSHPFYYDQIGFQAVKPVQRKMDQLKVRGDEGAGLWIWQLPFDRQTQIEQVRQSVAEAAAEEITRLLSKGARIGSESLRGGDFAVLVRTHQQAERIASALRERGINAVRSSQESVFWSDEAEALERMLMALLEPQRGNLLRAALATPLMGWDGNRIDDLNRDDRDLGECFTRFYEYHKTWERRGFIVMIRQLVMEESIENRLLGYRDGERRLTNLNHLLELLHQQERAARPGMEGLVKWLSRQCQSADQSEERLLRLESDRHLVQIATLHGSKGLEYDIVFCPYLWDESNTRVDDKPYLFHDPQAEYSAVLELGSIRFALDRLYQREEMLAENLRLLYVALTRAKQRCYLPWGRVKNCERSALAWLLHSGSLTSEASLLEAWEQRAKALNSEVLGQDLAALAQASQGSIVLKTLPTRTPLSQMPLAMPPMLGTARHFTGRIEVTRKVASFSSLIAGQLEDQPDYDAQSVRDLPLPIISKREDIHGFPRGAGPGSCLHAILETLDFTAVGGEAEDLLIRQQLRLHAIEESWLPVVKGMLKHLTATPLNLDGLSLDKVAPAQRINEMEFHFSVSHLAPSAIRQLADQYRFSDSPAMVEGLAGVDGRKVNGFMKGFVDLIFEAGGRYYLADYKSNWLGSSIEDYHQTAMQAAMVAHSYSLQYTIYTLALHRYLAVRLPDYDYERHFGGVYYLFLRGMRPQRGPAFGVVAEKPSLEFVLALDNLMKEAGREVS